MADQAMEQSHSQKPGAKTADEKKDTAQEASATSLGMFKITHYTFALESDPIHAHSPKVSAPGLPAEKKYRESFLGSPYGIEMQGTGLAEDGQYIRWVGGGRYAYGVGGAAGPPHAWKTCAVDPHVIPYHSEVEIEVYKGKGPFDANDTGGAIIGKHIDVFAGAVPISVAYSLGTKESEVKLLHGSAPKKPSGGGGEHKPSGGGENKTGGTQAPSGGGHQGGKSHGTGGTEAPSKAPHLDKGYRPAPTLAQVRAGHVVIEKGMEGESVKYVQGKVGTVTDGEFGPITEGKVKEYQRRHGLEVDGQVGVHTLAAMDGAAQHKQPPKKPPTKGGGGKEHGGGQHGGGEHGGGDNHHGGGETGGGDPVSIAMKFVGLPSWSPTLIAGLKPYYNNMGRETNNCAEFVSAVLQKAGRISFNNATVLGLESMLKGAGWKPVSKEQSKPGDVWIHREGPQHTVLIASDGGGSTLGADGSSQEYVKHEAMPYPGAYYYHKE
jgi:3D (Asp-Asp-Asp) domain-containing protein